MFYSWSGIFFVHLSIDFSHTSLLLLFCTWAYCSYGVMWFFYRLWSCYRIMKLEWTSWRGHCRTSLKGDYSSGDMETGWFVILTSGYTMIQVSCMDGNSNELYQFIICSIYCTCSNLHNLFILYLFIYFFDKILNQVWNMFCPKCMNMYIQENMLNIRHLPEILGFIPMNLQKICRNF